MWTRSIVTLSRLNLNSRHLQLAARMEIGFLKLSTPDAILGKRGGGRGVQILQGVRVFSNSRREDITGLSVVINFQFR